MSSHKRRTMSAPKKPKIDETDQHILRYMLKNGEFNLENIAQKVGVSKSTVHNRIKKLKDIGLLKGFLPLLDTEKTGNSITAIALIRAKYGPQYAEEVGRKLSQIEGVWAVYFVLGENDFVVLVRARTKDELEKVIEQFTVIDGVERSNTAFALKIIKEDPRDAFRI
jgi:Lrp/AsnC family leucine-responsive transcriptional regulator